MELQLNALLGTCLAIAGTLAPLGAPVQAMEMVVTGNTMILTGPVTGTEPGMVKDAFAANPQIDLVVLRNSYGGNAPAGYRVGKFFR